MCAKPMAPELFGEALRNLTDRQTAGIGGDDGAGFADGLDFF